MARPRKITRDETLAETRQQLLTTAAAVFGSEGYTGANINAISQGAGFAKGTIYNHFPSKRALMLTLIDEIAADHTRCILQQVEPAKLPIERLESFFHAGFAFIEQHPQQARVIVTNLYGPDAEFRARVYRAYQPLFDLFMQEIIPAGVARGDFRPIDPDFASALVMTIYLGSSLQLDPTGKIWLDPNQVAAFILDGLRDHAGAPR